MISLEQVRALETRVGKAVALIASLRAENASLSAGLTAAESKVAELEGLVAAFQKDQARIEEGIMEALRKLDSFEDSVHEAVSAKPAPAEPADGPSKRGAASAGAGSPVPETPPHKATETSGSEDDLAALELETRPDAPSDALDIF